MQSWDSWSIWRKKLKKLAYQPQKQVDCIRDHPTSHGSPRSLPHINSHSLMPANYIHYSTNILYFFSSWWDGPIWPNRRWGSVSWDLANKLRQLTQLQNLLLSFLSNTWLIYWSKTICQNSPQLNLLCWCECWCDWAFRSRNGRFSEAC